VGTYRVTVFVAACIGVVLFLYYPDRALLIAAVEAVFALLLWLITMRPVPEPDRALIYRLALLNRVAGPGYVFLIPALDHIEGTLDMGLHEKAIEVPNIRGMDQQYVRTNLEVSWRIHPTVQGRLPARVRETLLMNDQQREKMVEEKVILIARQVVNSYTSEQLKPAAAREAATATMTDAVNEILEGYGLQVERIFWRGSQFPAKLSAAQLEGAVRLEEAKTLIATLEEARKHFPDLPAEEFLALSAWLDMYRHGSGGGTPAASPMPPMRRRSDEDD
jgi:regulator of protease activity HflC (stomatin/prohibitin superfamily)